MKNILSKLGLATMICLSFILSHKTVSVISEMDEIMINIKDISDKYYEEPKDAIIEDNTIIPGLNGKKINIKKSYEEMKKIGKINEKYLIFDEETPKISINNNKDKIIVSGNKYKNNISLIIKIEEKENIKEILDILDKKNIKITFFANYKWLNTNKETITEIIKKGHNIGISGQISNTDLIWINNIIRNNGQEKKYCYYEYETYNECINQKNLVIKPILVNSVTDIKKDIKNGALIELEKNCKTQEKISIIIDYIKSRGLNINSLTETLSEKNDN